MPRSFRRRFLVLLGEMDADQRIALPVRAEQFVGQFRREIDVEVRNPVAELDAAGLVLVLGLDSVLVARYCRIPQAARALTKTVIFEDDFLFLPLWVFVDRGAVGIDVLH